MSIQVWNELEAIKDRLAKAEQACGNTVSLSDIAQILVDMKRLTERVDKLERKPR